MPPQVNIKVTADTKQAQQNINQFSDNLKKMQAGTNMIAQGLGGLSGRVNSFADSLSKASPRTLQLAKDYEKLMADFGAGNINLNQARAGIDSIQKELQELDTQTKGAGQPVDTLKLKWTEFSSALNVAQMAFRTVSAAAQKAYAFIKEGAAIGLAAIRFDRLASTVGTTGDALRSKLYPAIDGLLSKSQSMDLAGQLMSLGLAKTEDQVIRLATVVSGLGMDMNQLVLTLSNRTTMRFDALGVSVDGFKDNLKALEQQGLSTEDAFTEAFLQQAEAQIEKVGGVAETTAGKLMKLESSWKDMTESMKLAAAVKVTPILDHTNAELKLKAAVDAGIISYGEALKIKQRAISADVTLAELVEELYKAEEKNIVVVQRLTEEQIKNAESSYDSAVQLNRLYQEQGQVNLSTREYIQTLTDSHSVTDLYAQKAQDAYQASENLAQGLRSAGAGADELNTKLASVGTVTNFDQINTSLEGVITTALQQLELFALGWGTVQAAVNTALNDPTLSSSELDAILTASAVALVDIKEEAGLITTEQAVAELEKLGKGPEEAKKLVEEFQQSVWNLTGKTIYIDVVTTQSSQGGRNNTPAGNNPNPSGTGTGEVIYDDKLASALVSPVMRDVPFDGYGVQLHAGERFAVWNKNQAAPMGGQTINIVNNNLNPAVAHINAAMQADAIRQRGNKTMSAVRS